MTVYVDDMHLFPMGRFGRMKMSHMIADTEEELHQMAQAVGVARRWYQGDHYDVALVARKKAVLFGAKEITMRQLASMVAVNKQTGKMPKPDKAIDLYLKLFRARTKERKPKS